MKFLISASVFSLTLTAITAIIPFSAHAADPQVNVTFSKISGFSYGNTSYKFMTIGGTATITDYGHNKTYSNVATTLFLNDADEPNFANTDLQACISTVEHFDILQSAKLSAGRTPQIVGEGIVSKQSNQYSVALSFVSACSFGNTL